MKIISGKMEVVLKYQELDIDTGINMTKAYLGGVLNRVNKIEDEGSYSDEDLDAIRSLIDLVISDKHGSLRGIELAKENIATAINGSIGI